MGDLQYKQGWPNLFKMLAYLIVDQLAASDMQVPIGSRLETSDTVRDLLSNGDSAAVTSPTSTTMTPPISPIPFKARPLQLRPSDAVTVSLADQLAEETAATSDMNPWGTDGSDVKADDDWGACHEHSEYCKLTFSKAILRMSQRSLQTSNLNRQCY